MDKWEVDLFGRHMQSHKYAERPLACYLCKNESDDRSKRLEQFKLIERSYAIPSVQIAVG